MGTKATGERQCWRCREDVTALVCPRCEAIQPLSGEPDLFAVLGLPRRLVVDPVDLEQRYHDASRLVHPDLFQIAGARERELSVDASAAVNRAYRTLRDPIALGRYWLALNDVALGGGQQGVPPALAAQVFAVQEQLEELRAARAEDAPLHRRQVSERREEVATRLARLRSELVELYRADGGPALEDLRQRLAEIAYLRTLLGDIDETLEGGAA